RWMVETAPTRLEANAHADALFDADPAPTAAVCYNDAVALGLMLGLARLGRHPGLDFAVIGFDDISEAAVGVPPLTTVNADPRARAGAARRRGGGGRPRPARQHAVPGGGGAGAAGPAAGAVVGGGARRCRALGGRRCGGPARRGGDAGWSQAASAAVGGAEGGA